MRPAEQDYGTIPMSIKEGVQIWRKVINNRGIVNANMVKLKLQMIYFQCSKHLLGRDNPFCKKKKIVIGQSWAFQNPKKIRNTFLRLASPAIQRQIEECIQGHWSYLQRQSGRQICWEFPANPHRISNWQVLKKFTTKDLC